MEMIIGGVYQGKENYARKNFPDITWRKGSELTEEELYQAEGILGFHDYIKRSMKEGKDLSGLAQELLEKNPNVVLVSEEVGYGIVPADAFERRYRETVGRICTELAAGSSKVTRIVCGIGMVLKNA